VPANKINKNKTTTMAAINPITNLVMLNLVAGGFAVVE
jgi:hypothetical protein